MKHLSLIICILLALSTCLTGCAHESQAVESASTKAPSAAASLPEPDLSLSVEDAYAAIPHRRTSMDFATSHVPEQDRQYLELAFHLIDQSIRLRVATYRSFSSAVAGDPQLLSDMDRMIAFLRGIEPPARLRQYHRLLLQALTDQRAFFAEWQSQGSEFQYGRTDKLGSHPKVQSASNALREAYQILNNEYSSESSHNQDAFFDYHCALDFL